MLKLLRTRYKDNQTIFRNIFSLGTLQIFWYVLPLITLPYILRVIWPEKYGLLAFANGIAWYFSIIVSYGFDLTATSSISQNRQDNKAVQDIFWNVLSIKWILYVLSSLVFLSIVHLFFESRNTIIFYLFFFSIIWEALFPVWLFQGMEQMRYVTIINILVRVAFIPPIFLFIKTADDYWIIPAISSLWSIASWGIAFIFAIRTFSIHFSLPNRNTVFRQLQEWWHVFISWVCMSLYTTSTIFILWLTSSPTAVWHYASAEKIVRAAQAVLNPLIQSIFPNAAKKVRDHKEGSIGFLRNATRWTWGIALTISLILYLCADYWANILFGPSFHESASIIKTLSPLIFITWMSWMLGVVIMLNLWYKKAFSRILLTWSLPGLLLAFVLSRLWGPIWIASSVVITELIILINIYTHLMQKGLRLI